MNSTDLLPEQEYVVTLKKRSPFFIPLNLIFLFYLSYIFFTEVWNGKGIRGTQADLYLFIFVLPLIGAILFFLNKKAGWIICSLFFLFLGFMGIGSIIRMFIGDKLNFGIQNIIMIAVCFSACIMLSLESIRNQFRINRIVYLVVIFIAFLFALFIFYMVFYRSSF